MSEFKLPGKDCGICGSKSCSDFSNVLLQEPNLIERCIHLDGNSSSSSSSSSNSNLTLKNQNEQKISDKNKWIDHLGREYDFILDKYPGESGPRETIILFNPSNVEKLKLKKGDVIYGRPGWISCGCPVTHAGVIVEEPDYFNGVVVWCIVGPMLAREKGINIGYYNTTAYEGLIKESKMEIKIGMRHYFLPRFCMLQWRHSGLINTLYKEKDHLRVRIEGLFIG
ncbi:MAG: Fe-S cluster protein [Oligoflexia bacterium]|nr:Fe-S cluster protein [Oligoflexia bacterium]